MWAAATCLAASFICWPVVWLIAFHWEAAGTPNPERCGELQCDLLYLVLLIKFVIPAFGVVSLVGLVWSVLTRPRKRGNNEA